MPTKKVIKFFMCLILAFAMVTALCGCSLEYSELESDGAFDYACAKKKAFVYEYHWDGSEEGLTIDIPEKYGERKIVSLGGYFGRGLPMSFTVEIRGWLSNQPGELLEAAYGEEIVPDETAELVFTVRIGDSVEDVKVSDDDCIFLKDGERITAYTVRIVVVKK